MPNISLNSIKIHCTGVIQDVCGLDHTPEVLDAVTFSQLPIDSLDLLEIVQTVEQYYDIALSSDYTSISLTLDTLAHDVFDAINEQHNLLS